MSQSSFMRWIAVLALLLCLSTAWAGGKGSSAHSAAGSLSHANKHGSETSGFNEGSSSGNGVAKSAYHASANSGGPYKHEESHVIASGSGSSRGDAGYHGSSKSAANRHGAYTGSNSDVYSFGGKSNTHNGGSAFTRTGKKTAYTHGGSDAAAKGGKFAYGSGSGDARGDYPKAKSFGSSYTNGHKSYAHGSFKGSAHPSRGL